MSPHIRQVIRMALLNMRIEEIEHAYYAAVGSLTNQKITESEKIRGILKLGPEEPLPEPEADDEGGFIDEIYELAAERIERANNSIPFVRKAFVIGLFHLWERHCNSAMKRNRYIHDDVMVWMEANGRRLKAETLLHLELACHCAKHGPGNSCKKLWKLRPDLFNRVNNEGQASESTLVISNETFDEFLKAVSTSRRG